MKMIVNVEKDAVVEKNKNSNQVNTPPIRWGIFLQVGS